MLKGRIKMTLENVETGEKKVIEKDNLIVDVGANLVRDFLHNDTGLSGLNVMAIGDDNTAPDATQTALVSEQYRAAFTSTAKNNREVKFILFIAPTDWTGTVAELGLFGNGADPATPNSGTLFSRVTVTPFTKSDSEALTIEWTVSL